MTSPASARAEEKASKDFRAVIEVQMADLSQFHLPSQVDPHGPVAPKDEPGKLYQALGWATYGVSAGDALSTELVLARGGIELNPLQRNRAIRIGGHVAMPIVMNASSEYLRKKGRPRGALWMRIATVALYGYVTARNIRVSMGIE